MNRKILSVVLSFAMIFSVSSMTASAIVYKDPINLGTAGNYAILSKTGVSTVPNSYICGNMGVSPISEANITGFSLKMDATNEFSSSPQVEGQVLEGNYTSSTLSKLNAAAGDMETAYSAATGRTADYTDLYNGDLSGKTIGPGVYKWNKGVAINSNVTLTGNSNDVFIFQVAGGITQSARTEMKLAGEINVNNIFWIVGDNVSIGDNSYFEGNVLGKKNISLGTNTLVCGRLLTHNKVTLMKSSVIKP